MDEAAAMLEMALKLLGLSTASSMELVMFAFIASVLAVLVGFLIDACSEEAGFGAYGNAIVLISATLSGFLAYARFIEPLRHTPMGMLFAIGFASSVLGFLTLSYAKSRLLH